MRVKNCILRTTRALIDLKDAQAWYGARSLDFAQFPAALPDCKSQTTIQARHERNILLFTVSQSYESLIVDVLYYFPQENFDWRRFCHSHSIEIWLQKKIRFSLGMHTKTHSFFNGTKSIYLGAIWEVRRVALINNKILWPSYFLKKFRNLTLV